VCLTTDGGVFSWGHGGDGQLGHGTMAHQNTPRKIFELMGNNVCQVACGRRQSFKNFTPNFDQNPIFVQILNQ